MPAVSLMPPLRQGRRPLMILARSPERPCCREDTRPPSRAMRVVFTSRKRAPFQMLVCLPAPTFREGALLRGHRRSLLVALCAHACPMHARFLGRPSLAWSSAPRAPRSTTYRFFQRAEHGWGSTSSAWSRRGADREVTADGPVEAARWAPSGLLADARGSAVDQLLLTEAQHL